VDHNEKQPLLVEGEDYYIENGLMVLTARYLLRRGYCCEQGCRHCPYGYSERLIDEDQS
jgi:hypothetical protein